VRRPLVVGLAGLAVLLGACGGGPSGTAVPAPDLDAESRRITAEVTALGAVTGAEVRLRGGATWGRQVLLDAATDSPDAATQREVLEQVVRLGWHTTAFVPTEVRVTVVGPDGTTLDPRDLGFPGRGADSAGLFDLFGPPAADPDWRP